MTTTHLGRSHTLVIGDAEVARRVCASITEQGSQVTHLLRPDDQALRESLGGPVDAVAILIEGDVAALRYALLVEHLRPGIRLVVTIFDRTVSQQIVRAVPNCVVTSPADVSVPGLLGACLDGGVLAIEQGPDGPVVLRQTADGSVRHPWARYRSRTRVAIDLIAGQLRPYDTTSRMLIIGAFGLIAVLATDWLVTWIVFHRPSVAALYEATKVVATVGPGEGLGEPGWYLLLASVSMLVTIGLAALFTAGVVNRARSARTVGLLGLRTIPTRDQVVVVGLGQVGLRLCLQLRSLGVPVLAIERDHQAENLRLAKAGRIPVLLAHAEDRAVLSRLSLHRARALAAMGSDELDNIEVAITALAVCPQLRIVLRAGENDVISETRSLFHIGQVLDVVALTAEAVLRDLVGGDDAAAVAEPAHRRAAATSPGPTAAAARCACGVSTAD